MIMRYLQVGGLAAGLAGGSPGGLGNIADFVRGAPSQAAGMMENNPAIGPSLAQNFDPGQLKDVFSPIGVNRNEQNPFMKDDDKSPLPVTPVKGGGGGDWGGGGYAQGGYVSEPGYYQTGGSEEKQREEYRKRGLIYAPHDRPLRKPVDRVPYLEYHERFSPPVSDGPHEDLTRGFEKRYPTREVPYTEGSQRFGRPSAPISRQEYLSPVQQLSFPVPVPPDQMWLSPDWMNTTRGSRAAGSPWSTPGSMQRGGGLGLPQMNTAASQAHYSAINMRPAIGRTPGVHLLASSSIPGRTDRIPMRAAPGAYVLLADVGCGLGQGNTHAGAKMWGQAIMAAAGPAGAGTMGAMRRGSIPKATVPRMGLGRSKGFAEGGDTGDDYVPIITAGGEVLIDPEIVAALGGGSEILGKRTLAQSVMKVRKQVIEELKKLPRPVA